MGEHDAEYGPGEPSARSAPNPVRAAIAKAKPPKPAAPAPQPTAPRLPQGFRLTDKGLFFIEERPDDDGKTKERKTFVCAPLRVAAETRSADQDQWGRLLEWQDRGNCPHAWAIPMSRLEGEPAAFCAEVAGSIPRKDYEATPGACFVTPSPQGGPRTILRAIWLALYLPPKPHTAQPLLNPRKLGSYYAPSTPTAERRLYAPR